MTGSIDPAQEPSQFSFAGHDLEKGAAENLAFGRGLVDQVVLDFELLEVWV
jgi:hypothetical protein